MAARLESYLQSQCQALRNNQLPIRLDSTRNKLAVIVEPRDHPLLEPVIRNVMYFLPDWNLAVITVAPTADKLKLKLPNWEYRLFYLSVDNLNSDTYTALFRSSDFWEKIGPEEHILIFQTDSLILNNTAPNNIDKYLKYGYVGAPFDINGAGAYVQTPDGRVMNGGFSLRRRSAMLAACKTTLDEIQKYRARRGKHSIAVKNYGEDVFFVHALEMLGWDLPTQEEAKNFAIEDLVGTRPPLACHGWQYNFFDKNAEELLKSAPKY